MVINVLAQCSDPIEPGIQRRLREEIEKRRKVGLVPGLSYKKLVEIIIDVASEFSTTEEFVCMCFRLEFGEPYKRWANTYCNRDLEDRNRA